MAKADFSESELLLLAKFKSARSPSDFTDSVRWKEVLTNSPKQTISKFTKLGLLRSATLEEKLTMHLTIPKLKDFLKVEGISTIGGRADLVSRIVAQAPEKTEVLIRGRDHLICSEEGLQLVAQNHTDKLQRRSDVENKVVAALEDRDHVRASKLVTEFEAGQVFRRGLGIDWENYTPTRDVSILTSIFSSLPSILSGVNQRELERLRMVAALMHLWGTNRIPNYLPWKIDTGIRFNPETAARMLLFAATHFENLSQYRATEVRSVKIMGANDHHVCDICKDLQGHIFLLEEVPELPYASCTSDYGCRCWTAVEEFNWE